MSIIELLTSVGAENISVIPMSTATLEVSHKKHDTEVKLAVPKSLGSSLMDAGLGRVPQLVPMVVWFDRKHLPEKLSDRM